MNKIHAVIFDMDGLLVDSEPWWRVAETNIFGKLSVSPGEEDFERMMGNRIQEVITSWHAKHPWPDFSLEKTMNEIVDEVGRLVTENASLMPGVIEALEFFKAKNIPIALASSSPLRLINRLITNYNIAHYFVIVRSAEFEQRGKPSPDVFLTTAKALNVAPENCLVFEDSHNGVLAAKAAGMLCVAVPSPDHIAHERFGIADWKWSSLTELQNVQLPIFVS
jgi:sugar-phosphatase